MTAEEKKYLFDILTAIELIESFVSERDSFSDYITDFKTKSAVERQLGIIGEAVNKFVRLNDINTLSNAKQIISFRNRLIHSYDNIDDSIVWVILKNHLQPLKKDIQNKLSK